MKYHAQQTSMWDAWYLLLLQCGMKALAVNHAGLFCDRGNAEFENISLYALEE